MADRYLLANYNKESLKFVANGQPVEVALNLYPGQIFTARVAAIWKASGTGQLRSRTARSRPSSQRRRKRHRANTL